MENINEDLDLDLDLDPESISYTDIVTDNDTELIQNLVARFISDVIILHERTFYTLIKKVMSDDMNFLCIISQEIYDMISISIGDFYTKLFRSIVLYKRGGQENKIDDNPFLKDLIKISKKGSYDILKLILKLFHLNVDIHTDICREELIIDSIEVYIQTLINQINISLMTIDIGSTLFYDEVEDLIEEDFDFSNDNIEKMTNIFSIRIKLSSEAG